MSAINLPSIATVNGFDRVDLGCSTVEGVSPWHASIHGANIGQFGCTFGYGDTPEEALSNCIASALSQREAKGVSPTGALEFVA